MFQFFKRIYKWFAIYEQNHLRSIIKSRLENNLHIHINDIFAAYPEGMPEDIQAYCLKISSKEKTSEI